MKRFALIVLAAFLALGAEKNPRLAYIEKYAPLAVSEMERTGVPASITLAQGMLESNAGLSALAVKGNNHFGIKCHNDWTGKRMKADDNAPRECFRVYPNAEASFRDHSDFLRGKDRYKELFELKSTDYKGWARGLKKAGYATDPAYAQKLITIIEDYKLYEYDKGIKVEVTPPLEVEAPVQVTSATIERKYKESVRFSLGRKVYEQNGVPFVYAIEGGSWQSIAASNGLFLKEILRFNDLGSDSALAPGTMVYLARKKTQARPGVGRYVVGSDGETLWEISQRFGVRLASLQKMNPALIGKSLEEGDTIILRKR